MRDGSWETRNPFQLGTHRFRFSSSSTVEKLKTARRLKIDSLPNTQHNLSCAMKTKDAKLLGAYLDSSCQSHSSIIIHYCSIIIHSYSILRFRCGMQMNAVRFSKRKAELKRSGTADGVIMQQMQMPQVTIS